LAAARVLCRHGAFAGRRVFDLGCGIGTAGAAAARCGAEVWFADREPDALAFAVFNGAHNAAGAPVHAQPFDWSTDPAPQAMDLWLLCDLSYRPRYHDSLLRQLTEGLGHGALAIHCDPMRVESESFLRRAARCFHVHTETVPTFAEGKTFPMRITLIAGDEAVLSPWLRHLQPKRRPAQRELPA
jgi:predicted nicotinamide N-methyase